MNSELRPNPLSVAQAVVMSVVIVSVLGADLLGRPLWFALGWPVPRGWIVLVGFLTTIALAFARRTGAGTRKPEFLRSIIILLWLPLLLSGLVAAIFESENTYSPIGEASPTGCRAWAEESSFLFAGNGRVYVVNDWQPVAMPVMHYRSDDGSKPAAAGLARVTWENGGRRARIVVVGSPDDPVVVSPENGSLLACG